MKKICFVIQRYGIEVNGGAEQLCREIAERLTTLFDVSVFTTKAKDYITWKNEYSENNTCLNGVKVYRFENEQERDLKNLNVNFRSDVLGDEQAEKKWLIAQGPYCPSLIQAINDHKDDYDAFVFFTYLYYPTVFGMPRVYKKSIFVPTAHDEQYLYMSLMFPLFRETAGMIYLTETERKICHRLFHNENVRNIVGGCGIEVPERTNPQSAKHKYHLSGYIVYIGRIDVGKGCDRLFQYFEEYQKRNQSQLKLVLVGKKVMDIPDTSNIISLGFISEEDKYNVLAGAKALILPSQYESLSMVVLEAMALGIPVIVNAFCEVTKQHCISSNAGLYYENYFEFEGILNRLRNDPELCAILGKNGKQYVQEYYQWETVIKNITSLITDAISDSKLNVNE